MAHGNAITESLFSTNLTDAVSPKTRGGNTRGLHGVCHDGTREQLAIAGAARLLLSCLHAIIQP